MSGLPRLSDLSKLASFPPPGLALLFLPSQPYPAYWEGCWTEPHWLLLQRGVGRLRVVGSSIDGVQGYWGALSLEFLGSRGSLVPLGLIAVLIVESAVLTHPVTDPSG